MSKLPWYRDHISALIDAYKKEPCLYVAQHVNYHSKPVRGRAIQRVCEALEKIRPGTTVKDCLTKIHCMRNQFNVENGKRKNSLKSVADAADAYIPNLWYFKDLMFLEAHYTPRKKKKLPIVASDAASPETSTADNTAASPGTSTADNTAEESQESNKSFTPYKRELGLHMEVFPDETDEEDMGVEINLEDIGVEIKPDEFSASDSALSSLSSTPSATQTVTSSSRPTTPNPPIKEATGPINDGAKRRKVATDESISTALASISEALIEKRKVSTDESILTALASISEALINPIRPSPPLVLPPPPSRTSQNTNDDVGKFADFIESMIRKMKNEKIKIDLMSAIASEVFKYKALDLQGSEA